MCYSLFSGHCLSFVCSLVLRRDSETACSLCGPLPADGELSAEQFAQFQLSYEEFSKRSSELLNNPRLVFRLNGQYHPASVALPTMCSLLLFKKPIADDETARNASDTPPVGVPKDASVLYSMETLTAESLLLRPSTPTSGTPTSSVSLSPASVPASTLSTPTRSSSAAAAAAASTTTSASDASKNTPPAPKTSWFSSWRRSTARKTSSAEKDPKQAAESSKKQTTAAKEKEKEKQQSAQPERESSKTARASKTSKAAAEILSEGSILDEMESALSDTEIEQRNSTDRKRRMGTSMLTAQVAGDLSVPAAQAALSHNAILPSMSMMTASGLTSGEVATLATKCKSEEQVNVSHLMDPEQLLGAALPHPPLGADRVKFSLGGAGGSSERLRVQPKCQKAASKKHLSSRQLARLDLMTGYNHISYSVTTQYQGALLLTQSIYHIPKAICTRTCPSEYTAQQNVLTERERVYLLCRAGLLYIHTLI